MLYVHISTRDHLRSSCCIEQHVVLCLTYMNPAPPVTRMFLASRSGSNRVLPISTGACFQRSSVTRDLGLRIVEFRRPDGSSQRVERRPA